jgi:hypothetical protein
MEIGIIKKAHRSIVFQPTGVDDFSALDAAREYLRNRGFSVAPLCGPEPVGFMYGDYSIAKWHNLSSSDKRGLHGVLRGVGGSPRGNPVCITLDDDSPAEAKEAFDMDLLNQGAAHGK